jgi:mono/diheme cytochrome c family protein
MSLKMKTLICFVAIGAAVLSWPLFAGVCAQRVVKQRVVAYQQVYAQPVYQAVAYQQYASPYQYAIGSDLVLEALAEKLSARIEEKLIQRQQALQPKPQSIVAEKCSRCHMPNSKAVLEEEAVVLFDKTGQLIATPEQRAVMEFRARQGSMPPPGLPQLDDNEYLALVQELKGAALRDPPQPIRDPRSEPPPAPNGDRQPEPVPPPAPTPQGP